MQPASSGQLCAFFLFALVSLAFFLSDKPWGKNCLSSLRVTPLNLYTVFIRPSNTRLFLPGLTVEELVHWVLNPCECWKWKTGKEIICRLFLSELGNDMLGHAEESGPWSTCFPLSGSCCLDGLYPSSQHWPFLRGKLILHKRQRSLVYSRLFGFALNQT